jgi:hypothetical protein
MAETKTMLPVIEKFMAAHRLPDVTVVTDVGMITEASQIEAAGPSFILGMKIPDGHVFTRPWPAGSKDKAGTKSSTTSSRLTGRRERCAGSTSRSPRQSPTGTGQAEQVNRPGRRGQERQPRARGQGQDPGRLA